MNEKHLSETAALELNHSLIDLCDLGLITCTEGTAGAPGARYALSWLPLNSAEKFTQAVCDRHELNMKRLADGVHSDDLAELQKLARQCLTNCEVPN